MFGVAATQLLLKMADIVIYAVLLCLNHCEPLSCYPGGT